MRFSDCVNGLNVDLVKYHAIIAEGYVSKLLILFILSENLQVSPEPFDYYGVERNPVGEVLLVFFIGNVQNWRLSGYCFP